MGRAPENSISSHAPPILKQKTALARTAGSLYRGWHGSVFSKNQTACHRPPGRGKGQFQRPETTRTCSESSFTDCPAEDETPLKPSKGPAAASMPSMAGIREAESDPRAQIQINTKQLTFDKQEHQFFPFRTDHYTGLVDAAFQPSNNTMWAP